MAIESPFGNGKVKWVSTGWLQEHEQDENLTLLDCQPNVHDYILEHIVGAVYMNQSLLRIPLKGRPASYIDEKALEAHFQRLGLKKDVPVVVYTGKGDFKGWGDGLEQTFVAYTLAKYGHNNVFVLNGGLDKWKAEKRPLTKVFPAVQRSDFRVETHSEYVISYEDFIAKKDNDDVIVLDARPSNVYEGQGPWIKPGHIPGAVNLPWKKLMDDNNPRLLKPKEQIHEIVRGVGATPEKTVICSCGTGREATNEFLLFKWFLDYNDVKIYEGSFTEWTSYIENPTVVGEEPR